MPPSQREKGEAFRALHEGDPFLIPNPWDTGSARMLAGLGFKALASTSAGLAGVLGKADGEVTLDEIADHAQELDRATDLPVSMDLENGYGPAPEDAARAITRVAEAGAVGGSIEDWDRDGEYIYELEAAAERIAAAVEAARALDFPFTLTARAENYLRGNPDVHDTIRRLQAYEEAGADVLYAPWVVNEDELRALCSAVGKPVNALARPGLTMEGLVACGVQRVSVGGWLYVIASTTAAAVAEEIRDTGDFSSLRRAKRAE